LHPRKLGTFPFGLSLSKPRRHGGDSFDKLKMIGKRGFDRLSPNGEWFI
jgi:hypothetical protein